MNIQVVPELPDTLEVWILISSLCAALCVSLAHEVRSTMAVPGILWVMLYTFVSDTTVVSKGLMNPCN